MPRDDWANARAKTFGNRAARSGNCFRRGDSGKTAIRKAVRKSRQKKLRRCPHCGSSKLDRTPQIFRDGQKHIRIDCGDCNRFIKWL